MKTQYLFVDELASISERLRQVFEQNADGVAADISFRAVQQFQAQIQSWNRSFLKPPMALVTACRLELLEEFYRHRLDFSIFQRFDSADFDTIQEEISAYAAREALDALLGYRLRNWAAIGLQNRKWEVYQELVSRYYQRTVSQETQARIAEFKQTLAGTTDLSPEEIHAKCVGELFFEIDRIRLMPLHTLGRYLERLHLQATGQGGQPREEAQLPNLPEALQESFQLFGFTYRIDFNTLKDRYRQLALEYHPDKGGNVEMMQRLNAAYLQISDYLRAER